MLLLVAALPGCATEAPASRILQFGGMREVMREGRDETRVRLAELGAVAGPGGGLIAVGALGGLAGEVTADGETWWIATAGDERVQVLHAPGEHGAALLTAARVAAWDEASAAGPLNEARLGAVVSEHLRARGLDPSQPWAVRIEGRSAALELHVIRGDCPHAPDAAIPAWRGSPPEGTPVVLVGFHAPGKAGLLTHHGTEFHLHAILNDGTGPVAGHVDRFTLLPGARVLLARP